MKKQKIMLLLEITLFIMIVGTIVSYAAGSNPPSDGVKYNSTTVKAALDDLYEKVGSAGCNSWTTRNPDTSQIAVGGSRTYYSGIYPSNFTVSCANKTCPTCSKQKIFMAKAVEPDSIEIEYSNGTKVTEINSANQKFKSLRAIYRFDELDSSSKKIKWVTVKLTNVEPGGTPLVKIGDYWRNVDISASCSENDFTNAGTCDNRIERNDNSSTITYHSDFNLNFSSSGRVLYLDWRTNTSGNNLNFGATGMKIDVIIIYE